MKKWIHKNKAKQLYIKRFVLRKLKKRWLWVLKPEMSLGQLISSYLLSQIKHMQQGNNTKIKVVKKLLKVISPPSPPHPEVLWFFNTDIRYTQWTRRIAIHSPKILESKFALFSKSSYPFFLEATGLISN